MGRGGSPTSQWRPLAMGQGHANAQESESLSSSFSGGLFITVQDFLYHKACATPTHSPCTYQPVSATPTHSPCTNLPPPPTVTARKLHYQLVFVLQYFSYQKQHPNLKSFWCSSGNGATTAPSSLCGTQPVSYSACLYLWM